MTIRHLSAALLAALLAAGCATAPAGGPAAAPGAAQAAFDATGTYELTGQFRGQPFDASLRLARGEAGYTGTFATSLTGQMPVRIAEVQGRRVRVVAQGQMGDAVIVLNVNGAQVTGTWEYGPGGGDLAGRLRPS